MVYLLYKTQFEEERFGDIRTAPSILCGVFDDKVKAEEAKLELDETCGVVQCQFGNWKQEKICIIEIESNTILDMTLD